MKQLPDHEIPFGRPMIGDDERAAVAEVLKSPQLVHGPRAQQFEEAFAALLGGEAHATSVSSCTAGLHLIYMHLGIGPGDEVIVPALTHVATAHAVEVTGARPVFVDCDETGNIDVRAAETAVTDRTRAICVVHYPGLPVDVVAINRFAVPQGIFVVEDCALAVGGSLDGVPCGLLGDAASFSFYPVKHLTTGEGGMIVSRHPEVVASVANIKAFGYDRSPSTRATPGVYDVARLGLNYRMNEVAAAIGTVQTSKMQQFDRRRRSNASDLRLGIAGIQGVSPLPDGDERRIHANYCLTVLLQGDLAEQRNDVARRLKARGVGTSVYYPVALPFSSYYQTKYRSDQDSFLNARRVSTTSLALPVGPHLDSSDMVFIATELGSVLEELRV